LHHRDAAIQEQMKMQIEYVSANDKNFDAELYVRVLVAIAKADRFNGPPEYEYVKKLADGLSVDIVKTWNETSKDFSIASTKVSRMTAMLLIKDCIMLASLDGNFSLDEKQRVYSYAEKMDVSRSIVDAVEKWLAEYRQLYNKWESLVAECISSPSAP
jgi:hypothetical protein